MTYHAGDKAELKAGPPDDFLIYILLSVGFILNVLLS